MKPAPQTSFGRGKGNCLPACIASILEIDASEVPDFCREDQDGDGSNWIDRTAAWLAGRGYGLLLMDFEAARSVILPIDSWVICVGPQRGGVEHHAVIGRTTCGEWGTPEDPNGFSRTWSIEPVFDPNPKRSFLECVETLLFLVPGGNAKV